MFKKENCHALAHPGVVADSGLVVGTSSKNINKPHDVSKEYRYDGFKCKEVRDLVLGGNQAAIQAEILKIRASLPKFPKGSRNRELSREAKMCCVFDGTVGEFKIESGVASKITPVSVSKTQLKKQAAKLTKANFAFDLRGKPIINMDSKQKENNNQVALDLCQEVIEQGQEAKIHLSIYEQIDIMNLEELEKLYRYAQRKYDMIKNPKKVKQTTVHKVVTKPTTQVNPVKVEQHGDINLGISSCSTVAEKKQALVDVCAGDQTLVQPRPKYLRGDDMGHRISPSSGEVGYDENCGKSIGKIISEENTITNQLDKTYAKIVKNPRPKPMDTGFVFNFPERTNKAQTRYLYDCPIDDYPLFLWKRALKRWPRLHIEDVATDEYKRMLRSSLIYWTSQWRRSSTSRNPYLVNWNGTIRALMKDHMKKDWYRAYESFRDRVTSFCEGNTNPNWATEPKQK